jgi:hypothetical protein
MDPAERPGCEPGECVFSISNCCGLLDGTLVKHRGTTRSWAWFRICGTLAVQFANWCCRSHRGRVRDCNQSLIGLWAFWMTLKNRVRVWAHPKLLRLAHYDFANLSTLVVPPATCNHAIYVTAISLTVPAMAIGTGWMIYATTAAPPNQVDIIAFVGGMLLLVAWPVISIGVLIALSHKLFADGPADCWSSVSDEIENN